MVYSCIAKRDLCGLNYGCPSDNWWYIFTCPAITLVVPDNRTSGYFERCVWQSSYLESCCIGPLFISKIALYNLICSSQKYNAKWQHFGDYNYMSSTKVTLLLQTMSYVSFKEVNKFNDLKSLIISMTIYEHHLVAKCSRLSVNFIQLWEWTWRYNMSL